ncbi:hypothetical protein [Nonomuraea sp. NPDC046570]|uniref:hypothetical protein n=1 Tax=Nonomuraea sp. NPDC046570 TaxID=3155255 RepID=UPI003407A12D
MSEVVPLPSFGEVFFDARGQERCLRVTWHEGTLVLSLWRGEMCTGSFRMPMDDVGRLLDTLEDGFSEASGEIPAPEPEPVAAEYPGTGQYHRPPPIEPEPPARPQHDDRPTAALSPNDVLVARGAPAQPDKLVASFGEQPRETLIGPDGVPYGRTQPVEPQGQGGAGPVYQMPPQSTDPLGFPMQPADPYASVHPDPFATQQHQSYQPPPQHQDPFAQPHQSDPYSTSPQQPNPFAARSDVFTPSSQQQPYQSDPFAAQPQQPDPFAPPPRSAVSPAPGLGTPMHGIPGAGRRSAAPVQEQHTQPQDPYQQSYPQGQVNPADPLGLGGPSEPSISRPYVGDQLFATGERLRPEQHYEERNDRREW